MSIANLEQPAPGSPNLGPTVLAPITHVAKHRHHHVITKIMASAAIALSFGVVTAASASADPNSVDTDPNPFGVLSCNCQNTAPPDSPALKAEIDRGLREGHTALLPGLPAPAHPSQPRP
jgi:hypothetical protein